MKTLSKTQTLEIIDELKKKKIGYRTDVGLSVLSSFKIGGISPLVIEPETRASLVQALECLNRFDTT